MSCLLRMIPRKYFLFIAASLILDIVWSKRDDPWTDSQTASQSRIQQLEKFEQIHRAQAKNTQPKEIIYLDADDHSRPAHPVLTLQNVSTHIITMSVDVKGYPSNSFFSNAYALLFVSNKYFYYIKRGRISNADTILTWLNFLLYLKDPLVDVTNIISGRETGLVFHIWNPIQSGIVGFGIDKNSIADTLRFNLIYRNQTSRIDTTNQRTIAYIPEDFLQIIANDLPETTRDGFIALMFFSRNKINDSSNGVGFRLPQYCNRNGIAPLKVYFDSLPRGNWTNFGSFYSDNGNISYSTCLIEKMSYISFNISVKRYYKSYEKVKYCPATTLKMGSYVEAFEVTPHGSVRLPKSLSFDKDLNIVYATCNSNNYFTLSVSPYDLLNISSLITNQTLMMYRPIANILYVDYSNASLQLNSQTTYIDVYLYFFNLLRFGYSIGGLIQVFSEGVQRLRSQAGDSEQINHLAILTRIFIDIFQSDCVASNSNSSSFLYERITHKGKHRIGVALRSNNTIESLTSRSPKDIFVSANNADVIIKLSDDWKPEKFDIRVLIFTDEYYYKREKLSQTKIVSIFNKIEYSNYNETYLDVYLKLLDGSNNVFWRRIHSNSSMVFIFISKSNQNMCASRLMWNVIHIPSYFFKSEMTTYHTRKISMSILSQLSMLLKAVTSRSYHENYKILAGIRLITSILSITGISCIFLTCLLFKGWFKQRIYTNQLSITLLFQAIFFLLHTNLLNHIAFVLFYYSILTQFMWMAFLSYVQYVRFIFGTSNLSLIKSLIFGWGVPAVIIIASTVIYNDCLKCKFCSKNEEIFQYFVILPITIIIISNIGVYIAVRINMRKNKIEESSAKYRIRAIVAIPLVLGLLWIVLASFMAPSTIVSLVAWYLFYFIIPSQGFILFIFMVLLDKETRCKWFELLIITYYRCLSMFRG